MKFDLDKPFSFLEQGKEDAYLNKELILVPTPCRILDVKGSKDPRRPLFLGEFPFGVFFFDLPIESLKELVKKQGDIPKHWLGKTITLQAIRGEWNGKQGLTLILK